MQTPADIIQSEPYQLDRRATACKRAGDWAGAIDALQKRKALLGMQYDDDKLAKYLQAAGRLDDALAEINWLLDHSHERTTELFGHQGAVVRMHMHASYTERVCKSAVLICKRAKEPALQAGYQSQVEHYGKLRERLEPMAEKERLARFAVHEARMEEMRKRNRARQSTLDRLWFGINRSARTLANKIKHWRGKQ